MSRPISVVQYFGGIPTMSSKTRWLLRLLGACQQRGWQMTLVLAEFPTDERIRRAIEVTGCKMCHIPRPRNNFDYRVILRAYHFFRESRCDILHTHNICTPPLIAAALAGIPVRIWGRRDFSKQTKAQGGKVTGRLPPSLWVSSHLATQIHANSTATAQELIQLGAPRRRVKVWRNAIDISAYSHAKPADLRGELGIADDAKIIASVASLIPRKGLDLLLKAVGRIRDCPSQLAVVLVGEGPQAYSDQLRRIARKHNDGQVARFLGLRQDIPGILAASDIFVLPSRAEAFGFALAEALAAGLPTIAARVGGIPEFLEDEVNGLLFEREDIDGLERCLRRLLTDDQLRTRLRFAARNSVRNLDLDRQVNTLTKVYEDLVRQKLGGP